MAAEMPKRVAKERAANAAEARLSGSFMVVSLGGHFNLS
jgi:hypothetical protein